MQTSVTIAVLNYRRDEPLVACLRSLLAQDLPENVTAEILVVDNNRPARAADLLMRALGPLPDSLCVLHQPVPGIAISRNAALDHALAGNRDFLAFVDDDEVAEPDWLARLLELQAAQGAEVATGPLVPVYPETAPAWVRRGAFFEPPAYEEGASLSGAASNNVLIALDFVRRHDLRFDESLGTYGGEDTVFFRALVQKGGVVRWTNRAVVREPVDPGRMQARWLWRRWMTYGYVEVRTAGDGEGQAGWRIGLRALRRVAYGLPLALLAAPLTLFGRKDIFLKRTKPVCRGLSTLAALMKTNLGENKRHTAHDD